MNHIRTQHTFSGSVEQVYRGICDYESYPRHIQGVSSVERVEVTDPAASCAVLYELYILKTFSYVLDMYHKELESVAWQMRSSNFLAQNSGSWTFEAQGEHFTEVRYELRIDFKAKIPGPILKKLTTTSLPLMFKGFQKIIDLQSQAPRQASVHTASS